jgi:hypothetical protein
VGLKNHAATLFVSEMKRMKKNQEYGRPDLLYFWSIIAHKHAKGPMCIDRIHAHMWAKGLENWDCVSFHISCNTSFFSFFLIGYTNINYWNDGEQNRRSMWRRMDMAWLATTIAHRRRRLQRKIWKNAGEGIKLITNKRKNKTLSTWSRAIAKKDLRKS